MATVKRGYIFPEDMADILGKYCAQNAVNEAAFVRRAVAIQLAEIGIEVDPTLKHGGSRPRPENRKPHRRGLFRS